jgi:hypothetical protein
MEKIRSYIDREYFIRLGIDPQKAIEYVENKRVSTIDPIHVYAYEMLKKKPEKPVVQHS